LKDSWQDFGKDTCSAQLLPEGSKGISSIPLRKKAKRSATDEYFQNFWVASCCCWLLQKMKLLTRKEEENLSYSTPFFFPTIKF